MNRNPFIADYHLCHPASQAEVLKRRLEVSEGQEVELIKLDILHVS